jgi:hypothetical protein
MEGELMFGVHDHFNSGPAEVQVEQIPQLGGSSAYPDHPLPFCRSEKVLPPGVVFGTPEVVTVNVISAFDDQPQLSHS